MMDNKKIILILFCLLTPIFLLLLSYNIIVSFTNLTLGQENVFAFLDGNGELPTDFTAEEISHLEDVALVMNIMDYVFYTLLLATISILFYFRKDMKYLITLAKYSGITSVIVLCLKLLFTFLFFNFTFSIFHQIFFPQGNWTFAAESMLIQTFPIEFFMNISMNIFLLSLFFGILFIVLGYYLPHALRNRN